MSARAFISIRDTGHGIQGNHLPHIWEPFYTTKKRGTGLGLAICRNIIEYQHGGKIDIASQEGKGTTIQIELPIKQVNSTKKMKKRYLSILIVILFVLCPFLFEGEAAAVDLDPGPIELAEDRRPRRPRVGGQRGQKILLRFGQDGEELVGDTRQDAVEGEHDEGELDYGVGY